MKRLRVRLEIVFAVEVWAYATNRCRPGTSSRNSTTALFIGLFARYW
ncbi:MAG: hypothetical protein V7K68_26960 [Nostoc sp.]